MQKDIMAPEARGITRREMLFGAGILAAGYSVGQLATGTSAAHALPATSFIPNTTGLPWPAWTEAELETAARTAAIRGANQFRAGGG